MIDWGLTGREVEIAQALVLIATAAFIGGRFLPRRFRRPVGVALTIGYLVGVVAFMVWILLR